MVRGIYFHHHRNRRQITQHRIQLVWEQFFSIVVHPILLSWVVAVEHRLFAWITVRLLVMAMLQLELVLVRVAAIAAVEKFTMFTSPLITKGRSPMLVEVLARVVPFQVSRGLGKMDQLVSPLVFQL